MIIGFDGSRAFIKNRTGTENYSYQLLKALAKIDTENSYKVYLRPSNSVNKTEWPDNFQFSILNFPRLWTQKGLSLQTFKDKMDLLFVPSHTLPLVRKPGLKTIMTVHDLGAEYLPMTHQLKQRLYLKFITDVQLKSATKLIAVSEATKKDLITKVKLPSKNIKVIYEGFDSSTFFKAKTDTLVNVLNKFDLKEGQYFFFVGTIQPRKNLSRLIEAFKLFLASPSCPLPTENCKLVLAGSKGWLSDEIYRLPKKLGIEDKVKFLGRVEDSDLVALYSGAAAFTFPSLFEGFGIPILEAFACHCPVLTSKTSSMPEVAGKAAILVDPYNVAEIAKGLEFITKPGISSKLIQDGQKQLHNFSWDKAARQTLELFEEVKNGR